MLQEASQSSSKVFAILSSGYLSALPNQIFRLIKESPAAPRLVLIDSLSIGVGTGYLVEEAAEMIVAGKSSVEIEQTIRLYSSTIYTAVILPELKSLVPIGLVDAAQANAASILGIQSIFSMEEGLPTPLVKVRNRRGAYEYLIEFIDEFENFHLVANVQESNSESSDLQIIHDHLNEFYPDITMKTFSSNKAWRSIFGEHSYGLVIVSNEENN